MKLTKEVIADFEETQRLSGTKTALFNFVWQLGHELFKDIGVKRVRTSMSRRKK